MEGVGEIAHWVGDSVEEVTTAVTAITFGCAAIHFPTVYNLERHQRPVPFIK